MGSERMVLVVCVIGCAVSCIKAHGHLSTPTNLTSKINRNDCGKTKLCLETPKGCDPDSSQCFFTSVTLTNISLTVELSGNSTGYIALAARESSNVSQALNITFVCGNGNGSFFFRTTMLLNNTLRITNTPNVTSIQGSIQSSLIQCFFSIPMDGEIIHFLSNVIGSNFSISDISNSQIPIILDILKGSTNGTGLGAPTSVLESPVLVNLANVNSTKVVSTPASTTTSTPASTTVSTTASTTASTTVSTTTSTPARTTTRTTAHSNASISLTSLITHAAICFLSTFLHLI